jgi:hypothetical protein
MILRRCRHASYIRAADYNIALLRAYYMLLPWYIDIDILLPHHRLLAMLYFHRAITRKKLHGMRKCLFKKIRISNAIDCQQNTRITSAVSRNYAAHDGFESLFEFWLMRGLTVCLIRTSTPTCSRVSSHLLRPASTSTHALATRLAHHCHISMEDDFNADIVINTFAVSSKNAFQYGRTCTWPAFAYQFHRYVSFMSFVISILMMLIFNKRYALKCN